VSNAIDWATTVANLTTAIGSATGADLAIGTALRDGPPGTTGQGLAAAGAAYDARYAAAGVDTAKGAWLAAAATAWNQADHGARYALSLSATGAPSPLSFNAYDRTGLDAVLVAASKSLPTGSPLAADLTVYFAAFNTAWAGPTSAQVGGYILAVPGAPSPDAYVGPLVVFQPESQQHGFSGGRNPDGSIWSSPDTSHGARWQVTGPSVREVELVTLLPQIASAQAWLALLGF
jgi:hypothetical protein